MRRTERKSPVLGFSKRLEKIQSESRLARCTEQDDGGLESSGVLILL